MNTKIIKHESFIIEYFTNDFLATGSIELNKKWEPHILEFVKLYNLKKSISNIIDIGANFGYHTLFFSREVEGKGNVYSFEPQIQNYTLLYKNIDHNQIKNIQSFPQACSDQFDIVNLPLINTDNKVNMGDITLNQKVSSNTHIATAIPIDSLVLPKIDLIKIDVQGWEIKALHGAKELISKDKPLLIVEFEEHQLIKTGCSCSNLAKFIRDLGYYIYYLDYEYPSDHVCVHKDYLDEFENKFSEYISEHNQINNINYNVYYGVNKKIKMPY